MRTINTVFVLLNLMFLVEFVHPQEDEQPDTKPRHLASNEYEIMVKSEQRFLVNFVSPGCVKCNEFAPEYEEIARYYATEEVHSDIQVYIVGDLQIIRKQGLRRLPSIYYVRDQTPLLYTGEMNADAVIDWVDVTGDKFIADLNEENFEDVTQVATGHTTGDWLILFCDVMHPDCLLLLPMWESIAYRFNQKINVGVVDTPNNPKLVRRFNMPSPPTMHLFREGKRYVYPLQQRDDTAIMGFAENGYKHYQWMPVEVDPSPFDTLTENIADQLKEVLPASSSSHLLIIGVPVIIVIVLLICCCFMKKGGDSGLPGRTKKGV